MKSLPAAQVSKVLDEHTGSILGYNVSIKSKEPTAAGEGFYRTLDEVFRIAFRNALSQSSTSWVTSGLAVDGPVTIAFGSDLQPIRTG